MATEDHGFGAFDKATGEYQFFRNQFSGESPEIDRVCQGLYLDPQQRLWVLGGRAASGFLPRSGRPCAISAWRQVAAGPNGPRCPTSPIRPACFHRFVATENSGCFEWGRRKRQPRAAGTANAGRQLPAFQDIALRFTGEHLGGHWAKTLGGGASLYVLRPGTASFEVAVLGLQPPRGLEETVNDLLEDSNGNIWVATSYDWFYRLHPGSGAVDYFSKQSDFAEGAPEFNKWWVLLNMAEDPRGHIWFALKSGGVLDFDPVSRNFKQFNFENKLSSNDILSIEATKDGRIWVGTKTNGLQAFTPNSALQKATQVLGKNGGQANQYLSAVRHDESKGLLWLTTDNGLAALDPATGAVQLYGTGAGLRNAYLNGKGLAVVDGFGVLIWPAERVLPAPQWGKLALGGPPHAAGGHQRFQGFQPIQVF